MLQGTPAPPHLDALASMSWTWAVAFLPGLATALVILVLGSVLAGWASRVVTALAFRAGHLDETVRPVLAAAVRYGIMILVLVAALGQVGVQTASLLAVLGAAGLAIGLALQGTLTNIAAGIMLLWLRPFRVGDYIEIVGGSGFSGIIQEMGLFACLLHTYDGIQVFAPNSVIWNVALRNHSRNPGRLIGLTVTLPNSPDADSACAVLLEQLRGDTRILPNPAPDVYVERVEADAITLTCRFWASHEDVAQVQRTVVAEARRRLTADGRPGWVPKAITRTIPGDGDPSRLIGDGLPRPLEAAPDLARDHKPNTVRMLRPVEGTRARQ